MNKHSFLITINTSGNKKDTREYVKDALVCHGGCYHPESPFFGLLSRDVVVRPVKQAKK